MNKTEKRFLIAGILAGAIAMSLLLWLATLVLLGAKL